MDKWSKPQLASLLVSGASAFIGVAQWGGVMSGILGHVANAVGILGVAGLVATLAWVSWPHVKLRLRRRRAGKAQGFRIRYLTSHQGYMRGEIANHPAIEAIELVDLGKAKFESERDRKRAERELRKKGIRFGEQLTNEGFNWTVIRGRLSQQGRLQIIVKIEPSGPLPQPLKLRVRTSAPRLYDAAAIDRDFEGDVSAEVGGPDAWITLSYPRLAAPAFLSVRLEAEQPFEIESIMRSAPSADPRNPRTDS